MASCVFLIPSKSFPNGIEKNLAAFENCSFYNIFKNWFRNIWLKAVWLKVT